MNKAKQVKKPMSPQAKRNLANIFGSIISNQRAIDGAKEMPIWVAIIFLLLSILLPVIPMMVNTSNTYGSSFIDTYTYGLDVTLPQLTKKIKEVDGYEFKIEGAEGNKILTCNKPEPATVAPIASYTNEQSGEYNLMIYYSTGSLTDDETHVGSLAYVAKYAMEDTYKCGSIIKPGEGDTENLYTPSFVILHKERLIMYVYKVSTSTGIASTYNGCNWNNYSGNASLLERVTEGADASNVVLYNKAVFANWKTVLNESYLQQRDYTLLTSTFIYLGIYAALVIFMGLMVFLLTRGKNNVFRYLSFLTCEKIAAWASFTPGLIGLVLGFIFPSQSVLFFIMVLGVRIMWLSMKQLRPQNY